MTDSITTTRLVLHKCIVWCNSSLCSSPLSRYCIHRSIYASHIRKRSKRGSIALANNNNTGKSIATVGPYNRQLYQGNAKFAGVQTRLKLIINFKPNHPVNSDETVRTVFSSVTTKMQRLLIIETSILLKKRQTEITESPTIEISQLL